MPPAAALEAVEPLGGPDPQRGRSVGRPRLPQAVDDAVRSAVRKADLRRPRRPVEPQDPVAERGGDQRRAAVDHGRLEKTRDARGPELQVFVEDGPHAVLETSDTVEIRPDPDRPPPVGCGRLVERADARVGVGGDRDLEAHLPVLDPREPLARSHPHDRAAVVGGRLEKARDLVARQAVRVLDEPPLAIHEVGEPAAARTHPERAV